MRDLFEKTIQSGNLTSKIRLKLGAIIIVEQNGRSTQNEYGGYPPLHVGSTEYLIRKWKGYNHVAA